MPSLIDHVFVFLLVVALPVYLALHGWPRMKRELAQGGPDTRIHAYWWTIVPQLIATAAVLGAWFLAGRSASQIGLGPPQGRGFWIGLLVAVILGAGLTAYQQLVLRTREAREKAWQQLEKGAPFLPRSSRDMTHFTLLSVVAGVCEEIVYRGFLIWYLSQFTGTGAGRSALAVLIAAVAFGVGHLYQGPSGAIQVFGLALIVGGLYVATQTLWPYILLHVYVDINGGLLGLRLWKTTAAPRQPEAASAVA